MTEKKEGPILAMAAVTLVLIVVMASVSAMTLYTALYPPDFEKRAEQVEQERQTQDSSPPLGDDDGGSTEGLDSAGSSTGADATESPNS